MNLQRHIPDDGHRVRFSEDSVYCIRQ